MATDRIAARSRAKRAQIRRGATEVFLAQGYAGATMDAVARTAGVSKQTLYVYYDSKEALLVDVLTAFVRDVTGRWGPAAEWQPVTGVAALREALGVLARDVLDALSSPEYLSLVRIIIAESPRLPRIGELWTETVVGRVHAATRDLLGRAREAGVVRVDDVATATRLFIGGLLTYVLPGGILPHGRPPDVPSPDAIVDLFVRAVT